MTERPRRLVKAARWAAGLAICATLAAGIVVAAWWVYRERTKPETWNEMVLHEARKTLKAWEAAVVSDYDDYDYGDPDERMWMAVQALKASEALKERLLLIMETPEWRNQLALEWRQEREAYEMRKASAPPGFDAVLVTKD